MTRVLVAGVAAALLMATALSPAIANGHGGGGGFHGGGTGAFHGGGFHGGERFHEAFRGGEFHGGERFHDHDRFRGPVIVGGLALGLGAVGGAVIPPSVSYGPPANYEPPPVCYPPPPAFPPPPSGYCYGSDGLLYAL